VILGQKHRADNSMMSALELNICHRIVIDRGLFQTNKETVRKLICFELGRPIKRSGRMMHLKQIQIRSILGNRIRIQISIRVKSWIRVRINVKIKKLQISKWSHGGPWTLTMEAINQALEV